MRLTALDIREQQFRRVMRGFDPDEVVTFLDTVASEYEQLVAENRDLRQRLLDLEHQIAEFQNMEKALRDTLMTAERVTAETRDNAQKEAALILREAEVTAQQATSGIQSEILQKRRELHELQRRRKEYLLGLRSLAQSHLEMIESAAHLLDNEEPFASEFRVAGTRRTVPGVAQPVPGAAPAPAVPIAPAVPPVGPQAQVARSSEAATASPPVQQAPVRPASPLPTGADGVIPSAVPQREVLPQPMAQATPPAESRPHGPWAEASFEPGDLVPRAVPQGPVSAREAEHYRRGITPSDPLPSLLRGAGGPAGTESNPASLPDGWVENDPAHAVRPDGSQGD